MDWQGVKDKVIGRWKASRQKMEVDCGACPILFLCDTFSSGYSYILPSLRPIMIDLGTV